MLVFTAEALRAAGRRIFTAAGTPEDVAAHVTDSLVESNLAGHDSHGVIRIPHYVELVEKGHIVADARPSILRETPTTAVVSGNWAFGQVSATYATELAIAKAKESHLAAVGVVRCNHIGRLGEYAELATKAGMIAIMTVGGYAGGAAAPHGGAGKVYATNPFCFGTPADKSEPMIVDFATTVVAEGKLQVARAKKQPVPLGWIVDRQGQPTTDVEDFYTRGGMMLPFGAHKGYGLAMAAEILSATLPGVDVYREGHGGSATFVLVLDPDVFRPFQEFAAAADELFGKIKGLPAAPGFDEVLIPGEPERRNRAKRLAEGIPVPEETWRQLSETARAHGASLADLVPDA